MGPFCRNVCVRRRFRRFQPGKSFLILGTRSPKDIAANRDAAANSARKTTPNLYYCWCPNRDIRLVPPNGTSIDLAAAGPPGPPVLRRKWGDNVHAAKNSG